LEDCHEQLLRVPGAEHWGDAARIWPDGNPWEKEQAELPDLVTDWRQHIGEHPAFTKEVHDNWNTLADYLQQWVPGKELFKKTPKLITQAVEGLAEMKQGKWGFENRNKAYSVSADFSQKLARILHYCIAWELEMKLERTRGIHGLLDAFEEHYDSQVRRAGRLIFGDLPLLLAPGEGRVLLGGVGPDQLDLEYRLDGAFDHWLLDEFQDTSTVQWRAVANLIDEVVQDPSGERTFFCVGDQKQSIYQWRGGDHRLFDRVAEKYAHGKGDEFEVSSLDVSWRSCPDVLKMVNLVFGDAKKLAPFDENKFAVKLWSGIWKKHESAPPRKKEPGHSLYLQVDDKEDRWPVVAQLLKQLQPIANRLECAILVQTNDVARELVNHLRGAGLGMPIVGESATNLGADNPLGMALLSLFRATVHPEDRFSAGHVRLTPLAKHLPEEPDEWQAAMRDIQHDIFQQGFEAVAREWIKRLEPALDDFGRWRAPQFLELARQFDQSGSRDIDAFLRFVPAQEIAEASGSSVVQVMTIHKAKGLTFDLTIVPDLEGKRLDQARNEALHTQRKKDGEPDWILDLPSKDICAQDVTLKDAVAKARSEACYESLCKLYVSLTRSSHGLYVITSKTSGNSQNYAKLLSDTLDADKKSKTYTDKLARTTAMFESATAIFESGDLDSMKTKKKITETPETKFKPVATGHRHLRLPRRRPSTHGGVVLSATSLFEPHGSDAASFGRAVHGIFEEIKWCDESTAAVLEAHRENSPDAVAEVEQCLRADEVASLFTPNPGAEVWLERAFELVVTGELCSGVFDRVVLHGDSAQIIDFKTDHVEGEEDIAEAVERHRGQLEWYRLVLAQLTGLPEAQITCRILFTHPRRVVTL
jgi:ATP-dependent exoDNAse (exonuclease V) beta subunit